MPLPLREAAPLAVAFAEAAPGIWRSLLPGITLWALALYLPLSLPLQRFEESLAAGPLAPQAQQFLLVVGSLALALAVGVAVNIVLSWSLGPSWAASLGLMAVLSGLFWSLASRRDAERDDGRD
jgi:protein-S-isoprenylcysteine O-methyltransferase Ste14